MRVLSSCALVVFTATAAGAQAPPAPSPPPASTAWSVAAGYASLWHKDVSRSTIPVDASPVAWSGDGPAIEVLYDRWRPGRLHRVEATFTSAGGFVYDTPVARMERPTSDSAWQLGGRYEYRRYPFRDVGLSGLDLGIGVEGGGEWYGFDRHVASAIEIGVGGGQLETGVVAAVRLQRSRVDVQAAWTNGLTIGRAVTTHSTAEQREVGSWGGGWLTDLALRGSVQVAARARVVVSYLTTGRGRFASHDAVAIGRARLVLGMTYAR